MTPCWLFCVLLLRYALARELLAAGDRVVICGRDEARLQAAVEALRRGPGGSGGASASQRVHGVRCDVSSAADVSRLGEAAQEHLGGRIDLWLNNAGAVTAKRLLADVAPDDIASVVGTNVLGSLLGSREAVRVMRRQPAAATPRYHIFNAGFSAWGAAFSKSAATHKATKAALSQLSRSLAEELAAEGLTGIGVHNLSPGVMDPCVCGARG